MRSYSETDIFKEWEVRVLKVTEAMVSALPDSGLHGPLRCHEVARAVRDALGLAGWGSLEVQDGMYGFADHSWLWLGKVDPSRVLMRHTFPNILDPYCVGSLPVVRIIDARNPGLPHVGWAYRPGPGRCDVDEALVMELVNVITPVASSFVPGVPIP